jgi:hypothetical protein
MFGAAIPVVLNERSIVHSDEIRHDVRSKEVGTSSTTCDHEL